MVYHLLQAKGLCALTGKPVVFHRCNAQTVMEGKTLDERFHFRKDVKGLLCLKTKEQNCNTKEGRQENQYWQVILNIQ